jgi:hypothetical protein
VPFRSSKLTNVLKDSLGGNCRTRMIACVWPDAAQVDETLATLRFSSRMMQVTTTPAVNVSKESAEAVAKYASASGASTPHHCRHHTHTSLTLTHSYTHSYTYTHTSLTLTLVHTLTHSPSHSHTHHTHITHNGPCLHRPLYPCMYIVCMTPNGSYVPVCSNACACAWCPM